MPIKVKDQCSLEHWSFTFLLWVNMWKEKELRKNGVATVNYIPE